MIDAGLCAQMGQRLGSRGNLLGLSNGTAKRNVPAPDPNSDMLHPLACQMVRDWCGPHHVSGLDGELYWFLAVCPHGEHWVATATKKTEFIIIIDKLLRQIRGLVGDDLVRFVKFD